MRTTLDIDEDVLAAAKELARRQRLSTGRVVSRLLREGFRQGPSVAGENNPALPRRPLWPFPVGWVVTNDEIDALREAEGV